MDAGAVIRRRPVAALATTAFVVSLLATAAYFAGLAPGAPKTLPTFVDLVAVTTAALLAAVLVWAVSLTDR